jgi:hypothetical protein
MQLLTASAQRYLSLTRDDLVFFHQFFFAFHIIRIQWDAVDWANLHALWLIVMPHTLSAQVGINFVDLFTL